MSNTSRRNFLSASVAGVATVASSSSFAATLARALATPANNRTGTIQDVEHIVIFMQENRSFDSYYGTLAGARGFSDPRAIPLPSGEPVFVQPNGTGTVLPYHFDIRNTSALRVGLDHSWKGTEAAWKDWNVWVAKKSVRTMGYFDRSDLPFYYALADAFTVCDAYHCSVFGPTDPNRLYALSGQSNLVLTGLVDGALYNVNNGTYNADIANDTPSSKAPTWQTYAEVLEANGVSWKVYQEWDNYGDNYLQYFKNFRVGADGKTLTPDSPLYQKGRVMSPGSTAANAAGTTGQFLLDDFAAAVKNNTLPQVSYIVAPYEYSEHPSATPNAGENFSARLLAALVANPEVWAKTALIITYDENDGFFDHMPATMSPESSNRGRTTLANGTQGEVASGQPVGLGPRVPVTVVSPWSKGGRICSQLFDHTSVIRFMEEWMVGRGFARNQVTCTNISPWRRAVCGDMTSAFNFAAPNTDFPSGVPNSAVYFKNWGSVTPTPPKVQVMPKQEMVATGVPRPAAPLPYRMNVTGAGPGTGRQFALNFTNTGTVAAAFIVYSTLRSDGPWHYTVEAGKSITNEIWNWSSAPFHLSVHGHNGFMREYQGSFDAAGRFAQVSLAEDPANHSVQLTFKNTGTTTCSFKVVDAAYGDHTALTIDVPAGQTRTQAKTLDYSRGWYDLVVTLNNDSAYRARLAGHLEGAGLDFTDPVLNGLADVAWVKPPVVVAPPPPPPQQATFTANTDRVRVGDAPVLTWGGLTPNATNWIGVYKTGQTPGGPGSFKWNYIATASGTQTMPGLPVGDYFIGLFLNDGYSEAAPRLNLKVLKVGDVNGDGVVDVADRDALRGALNVCEGQPGYLPLANFDADKCITQADYKAWAQAFAKQ
ncbi:MAG: phospholipase phosphocholine-specific [Rhizobacter sp.]|nr:phospholipase phosphocholine-specific [Rhizobacter sp.]